MRVRIKYSCYQLIWAGRQLLFHGTNAVAKSAPWYPELLLDSQYLALHERLGFNLVRLGVIWPAFEPTEGKYNKTYIEVLKKIVRTLGIFDWSWCISHTLLLRACNYLITHFIIPSNAWKLCLRAGVYSCHLRLPVIVTKPKWRKSG